MTWLTIGFEKQKQYFEEAAKRGPPAGGLVHAYLFTGPEMIGKQMFAKDLFTLVNDRLAVADPDLMVVSPCVEEDKTKIYIEDVRDVKTFLSLKPYFGPYKFVIINDADRLTPEASNALLKVLEEPAPHSILVLVTSRSRTLLPTITSRCQHINFLPHSEPELVKYLISRKLAKDDQALLISMAHGRIGWADWAAGNMKIVRESVTDLQKVLKAGLAERMAYAKKIYEKETYPAVVSSWIYWLHGNASALPKAAPMLRQLSKLNTIIAQPQYNHRLAIENTLINL